MINRICKATPKIQTLNAKVLLNVLRYVDKIIKAMEKVPEFDKIIGFERSLFTLPGYRNNFKISIIINITPTIPHINLKLGL